MYMHACVCVYIYTLELFIPQTQMHKIQTLASHRLNRFSMEGGGEGGMFIDCPEQMTSKLSKTACRRTCCARTCWRSYGNDGRGLRVTKRVQGRSGK